MTALPKSSVHNVVADWTGEHSVLLIYVMYMFSQGLGSGAHCHHDHQVTPAVDPLMPTMF